jgi:secreted trypsin-like serine protease
MAAPRYTTLYLFCRYVFFEACGERNEEPRVVGGMGSDTNAFPWLARLIYHKAFGCGASLINDRYVISAAHCIKG